ncbi:MAG: S49 family peptidase, partial [Leptospiraceae bacterium]|nr:S49 family peptidase [Leptospiraceae bacterium]
GEFYELFLERVGRSRKIGREAIIQEAGGKVYTGKYAESKGMVDKNGGLALAIELAMAKAEISEDYAQILVYPEGETSLLGLGDTDRLMLPALVKTAIRLVARSEQIRDDKVLMLMPYELDIR